MTYPLTTVRLSILPLAEQDAAAFVAYRQDADVARWQGWDPTFGDAEAAELISSQPTTDLPDSGGWLQLAICDVETGKLFGDVAIHTFEEFDDTYEIGITLASASQHLGIATEALKRVLDHLFTAANAHRVIANCDTRNDAVAKLLTGLGMRKESIQVDVQFFKGEWITLDGYAILANEYSTSA